TNLVPPGTSVHTWEPSASALRELSKADLFVMNGLDLEPFAEDLIESAQNAKLEILVTSVAVQNDLQDVTEMVELEDEHEEGHKHEHHHDGQDPHIWLSPFLAVKQVEAIKNALIRIDPENASAYRENTAAYITELRELDKEIHERFRTVDKKDFIVFHNAYDYFFSEYGLSEHKKAAVEPFPGQEPTAAYFQKLIELIEDEGTMLIFTEPQFNPRVVQNIQEETEAKSFEIDPIGLELSKECYGNNLRSLADAFITAFSQ
ncbi:zinc ABC transporter substrate-binding protein, partial [Candidatus Peregrinibacteria bacterium]|nr:zinc ABC transporter substrate-binding protein [Candidatus Peregrinibacteria bacterium]